MSRPQSHHLALAIARKTWDENRFKHAKNARNLIPPNFEVDDRVFFKNQATWQMTPKMQNRFKIYAELITELSA